MRVSGLIDRFTRRASQSRFAAQFGETVDLANRSATALFLVGGAVRDALMGATDEAIYDVDFVVEGDALSFADDLGRRLDAKIRAHEPFLTAELTTRDGLRIDIAAARRESYPEPASLPQVTRATLVDDLARRDFSVNSMAIPLTEAARRATESGNLTISDDGLIDPLGGRDDLASGKLRVLHDKSFFDDPTRILRGLRLGLRLGFAFDPATAALVDGAIAADAFTPLSGSRLRAEWSLLLDDPALASEGMWSLSESKILAGLAPGLDEIEMDRTEVDAFAAAIDRAASDHRPDRRANRRQASLWFAWLTGKLSQTDQIRFVERLDLDGDKSNAIRDAEAAASATAAWLIDRSRRPHEIAERFERMTPEALVLLDARPAAAIRSAVALYRERLRDLRLTILGRDLLDAGVEPGPEVGRALRATHRARLDGEIGKDEELRTALSLVQAAMARDSTGERDLVMEQGRPLKVEEGQ